MPRYSRIVVILLLMSTFGMAYNQNKNIVKTAKAEKSETAHKYPVTKTDAEWKKLSSSPQYQNNVQHIDITFLRPLPYSDF